MLNIIDMDIDGYHVFIDNDNSRCIINDKLCKLKEDDVGNIIRIIRNWDDVYINNKIIGENHYSIRIVCDGEEYCYRFYNEFPSNFLELVCYIGGLYDR